MYRQQIGYLRFSRKVNNGINRQLLSEIALTILKARYSKGLDKDYTLNINMFYNSSWKELLPTNLSTKDSVVFLSK